jgi:cytochrome b561
MQTTPQRFGLTAIALHWLIAALVIATLILAWIMETLDRGATKDAIEAVHKSIGLTILAFTFVRLIWRWGHRAPPLPAEMSRFQRAAAWATHAALYFVAIALPITGYLSEAARGRETKYFNLVSVPQLSPLDRHLSLLMEKVHDYGQYVLYALLAAHVGAALYHRFVLRDRILARMWPFDPPA